MNVQMENVRLELLRGSWPLFAFANQERLFIMYIRSQYLGNESELNADNLFHHLLQITNDCGFLLLIEIDIYNKNIDYTDVLK